MSFLKNLVNVFKPGVTIPGKPVSPAVPVVAPSTEAVETRAKEIILEAKDKAISIQQEADAKARQIINQLDQQKEAIFKNQAGVEREQAVLQERQRVLQVQEKNAQARVKELEHLNKTAHEKLRTVARLTRDEAKALVLKTVENNLTEEIALRIKEAEEKIREESQARAKQILVDAMYHGASDYVAEYTVSTVKLSDEDMKGRIIGREGRNIRAFEKVTGVDVDLDEEGVIRLSSFDSVRREIARVALEKLMVDGRIQPVRIEEVVDQVKKQIERLIYQEGEKLCHKVKVFNLPREVVATLGRFKYRFSYGQNMVSHTLEETKIAINLAHELKADVNIVRLGCLLHDIGKVVPDEDGSHVEIGAKFLKRHNIPRAVINCVAEHHEDKPFSSIESTIVYIADAISGSRPGARYEDYEEYVQRLEQLEEIVRSFKGVNEVFAIQAGREIRVVVDPKKLTDAAVIKLAADIKTKISQEAKAVPGQIRVTVLREFRSEATID
ncbi:ribonuclease Y [Patescibacteria group bacterium]|nr:ribonuclease Y [Patescibacteria group bacterium]MBU1931339.1 ribonuclease Y [Patescibacteria group bacterium]